MRKPLLIYLSTLTLITGYWPALMFSQELTPEPRPAQPVVLTDHQGRYIPWECTSKFWQTPQAS